jgi:hypothetical protein
MVYKIPEDETMASLEPVQEHARTPLIIMKIF